MSSLHPFGPTFKKLRVMRGYSLKEAAGNIVSPQFLSQFEHEKKGMSIENFSRLLISIGIDWAEFAGEYTGERTDSFNHIASQMMIGDTSGNFRKMLPKMREELKDYYLDNPNLKEFWFTIMTSAYVEGYNPGNSGLSSEQIEILKRNLMKQEDYFNLPEVDAFNILLMAKELPLDYILKIKDNFLKDYQESYDTNSRMNAYNSLGFILDYLLDSEYFLEAQKLIDGIRSSQFAHQHRMAYDAIDLEISEIFLWLKQNKQEAIPKARRVLDFFDIMKQVVPANEHYILKRSNFIRKFEDLNKTGRGLYDDI